jgi:tRNA threonylcarbamoyladenosine dehydratase
LIHRVSGRTFVIDADEDRRFGGLARLYGVPAAQRIRSAHVIVVGIGGVGSWAVEALARSGIGSLTLIDMDHIAESNVNRQIHALSSTLGQSKIEAMTSRVHDIHPACQVHVVDDFVTPENWASLAARSPDAVIDACDHLSAKLAMAAWHLQQAKRAAPLVIVGAAGGKRLAHRVDVADLSAVTHDPLLAQLRQRLRKFHGAAKPGKKIGLHCIYSPESVQAPHASCNLSGIDGSLGCHGYGSLVTVTASFGFCAANEVLNFLALPLQHSENGARI